MKNDNNINLLNDDMDELISEKSAEISKQKEYALSIQDPSLIGPDEYVILLDYSMANIYSVLRNQIKTKIPDQVTIKEMAKEAISLTIATYDMEIAIEKNATIRTHLGWKVKQVVTDYARALSKANANELNTSNEDMASALIENTLQSDIDGNSSQEHDVDMAEHHDSQKFNFEQSKKIEWAMRQVRFELSRESNLILDVGIGGVLDSNDEPYNLAGCA